MRVDPVTVLRPVYRKIATHNRKKKEITDGFQSDTKPILTSVCVTDAEGEKYPMPNE